MRQEVDFVKFLNREDYDVLRKDPFFKTYEISTGISTAIVFDLQDPILSDIQVRRAIAQGIDVERMLSDVRIGGVPGTGMFQPDSIGFNPDVKPLTYDPQAARRSLDAAGWKDMNGDGLLEKDGKPLEIKMLVDGRSAYYQVMVMVIRQQLSEIGIKLVVHLYQDEKEFTPEYVSTHKPQAWLRSFVSLGSDPGIVLEQWYPSGDLMQKLWHYKNPQLDDLIKEAKVASDKTLRGRIYQQVHKIVYEDQPACFLFSFVTRHAVARKFSGTDEFFFPLMPAYMMKDWYLARISR
jgi:peptide/nickel transport system substrate-binding protein